MSTTKRAIVAALKAEGAVLQRHGKHDIWQLPNGNTVAVSRTRISDDRAFANFRADLRRAKRKEPR